QPAHTPACCPSSFRPRHRYIYARIDERGRLADRSVSRVAGRRDPPFRHVASRHEEFLESDIERRDAIHPHGNSANWHAHRDQDVAYSSGAVYIYRLSGTTGGMDGWVDGPVGTGNHEPPSQELEGEKPRERERERER